MEDGGWLANRVFWAIGVLAVVVIGGIVKFSRWTGKVDADRASFASFMTEIRDKLDQILLRLPRPEVASASPITLTDFGRSLALDVGAGEVARGLVPSLREPVRGMDPYQLQEYCLEFMADIHRPPPELDSLINKVAYDRGVKREQVLRVIAIELRDQLLADSD